MDAFQLEIKCRLENENTTSSKCSLHDSLNLFNKISVEKLLMRWPHFLVNLAMCHFISPTVCNHLELHPSYSMMWSGRMTTSIYLYVSTQISKRNCSKVKSIGQNPNKNAIESFFLPQWGNTPTKTLINFLVKSHGIDT